MENKSLIAALQRISWKEETVVTTAQLAEFYECTTENIRDNFRKNGDRFVSGKHFFKLEGDLLRVFKDKMNESLKVNDYTEIFRLVNDRTPSLYLWTKRGAARHAKMLNTDRAWEVFELLEDNYFDRPQINPLAQAISELAAVEREKLALERDKFNVENSEATKTFTKVQLLRELASASKDEFFRYTLIKYAATLLTGEKFESKNNNEFEPPPRVRYVR